MADSDPAAEDHHGSGPPDALMAALVDRLLGGQPHYTPEEIAVAAGVDRSVSKRLWRAMGLADVPDDEAAFTDLDLEALKRAKILLGDGDIDIGLILQLTRVLGLATARIADSVVGFSVDRLIERGPVSARDPALVAPSARVDDSDDDAADNDDAADDTSADYSPPPAHHRPASSGSDLEDRPDLALVSRLLGELDELVVYLVHRHLIDAAGRRLSTIGSGTAATTMAVGFVDVVGFTSISQGLSDHDIVTLVERFEALTSNEVVGAGGRIIKMIGDEVMFAARVESGPDIALRLAETFDDPELPEVRVGLASGAVVERSGDLFGPVVNLAARATSVAHPGTVVVAESVHQAVADDPRYNLRHLRPRRLKGLGFVDLWVLRRAKGHDDGGKDHSSSSS